MPKPVRQLVNTTGLPDRRAAASAAMTPRSAVDVWGEVGLVHHEDVGVADAPGLFLRGILSPAATSMT